MAELLSVLLSDVASRSPARTAVEDDRAARTYGELARQVGILAAALTASGIRPGDRVGVLMSKSVDTVASLYAAMWAGGAYVPLDVGAPSARILYMIRNCEMSALLTTTKQLERIKDQLADTALKRIILLDVSSAPGDLQVSLGSRLWALGELERHSPLPKPVRVGADDLAYILYTSGSTGEPKGVMISHRNALAFVEWAKETVGLGPHDRVSSHAPFHFDLSVFDLYSTALAGATMVLVPEVLSLFPPRLAEWIESKAITVWYSVPSILVQLLDRGALDRFRYPQLRCMVFAGEVFPTKYLRAWMQRTPNVRWFNWYGPTETNVCTSFEVTSIPTGDAPVSIGCAASGDTIFLCDEEGRVVTKTGEEGEIWVRGPTVAQGYWGDQAKTIQRFISAPQVAGDSRPVYRTGDLACWDDRGNLTFKGRRDHMIKSRGYRIELGELEAAAASHPAVQEFCAVGIPDPQIGNRIRAYVAAQQGQKLDRDQLERHLAERLPRYMLPQEVVFLAALPKTPNGKIDRRALAQAIPHG